MNNLYIEYATAKVHTGREKGIQAGLIAAMVLAVVISLYLGFFFIGILAALVIGFFFRNRDYQYEYIFLQDEINIDKIIRKEKRKHVKTIPIALAEQMVPLNQAPALTHISFGKTYDFTTGDPHANVQILVLNAGGNKEKVLWEPDSELIDTVNRMLRRR